MIIHNLHRELIVTLGTLVLFLPMTVKYKETGQAILELAMALGKLTMAVQPLVVLGQTARIVVLIISTMNQVHGEAVVLAYLIQLL